MEVSNDRQRVKVMTVRMLSVPGFCRTNRQKGNYMGKSMKLRLLRTTILCAATIVIAGCSFDVSVPVLKGLVLPSGISLSGAPGTSTGEKITVGPLPMTEICGFQNADVLQENLIAQAEQNLVDFPIFLLNTIKIEGVLLNKVEFRATTGNFNTLTHVIMDMGADGENSGRYEAQNPEGLGLSAILESEAPFDLIQDTGGNCFKPVITLEGSFPPSDVIYDMILHLTVKYRIGL